jgi:hypothetical protein
VKIHRCQRIGFWLVLGLLTLACGITSTATPDPNVPVNLGNACEYDNQVEELEGQLVLPNGVNCSSEEPVTCEIYFSDPLNNQGFNVEIPAFTGTGEIPINTMAGLPDPFDSSDFYIRTMDGSFAGDGDLVSIRGTIEAYANTCRLTQIGSITRIDHLVYPGLELTHVTLQEALTEGLVVASITGNGLTRVSLKIKPTVELNLEIEIIPGTIFLSGTEGVQNMVVRQHQMVYLKPEVEVEIELEAACINMDLKQPTYSDVFTISTEPVDEDLARLLALEDFRFQSTELQQFAVWTITSNPYNLFDFVRIESDGYSEGMMESDVDILRALFEEADIDTSKYWIFTE